MLYPHGRPGRDRTFDQKIKSLLLYQLSYGPKKVKVTQNYKSGLIRLHRHHLRCKKVKADFTLTWRVNRAALNKRTNGTPAKTWTWNPQIRNLMLYPVELQGHGPRGWNWTTYHSFIRTVLWPMSYSGIHGQNKPPFSGPQMAKRTIWCPGWDLNPHFTDFKSVASAVGLLGHVYNPL